MIFLYLKSASDLHLQFEAYCISERCSCFYMKKKIIKNCVRSQNFTHIKIHNKIYSIPYSRLTVWWNN